MPFFDLINNLFNAVFVKDYSSFLTLFSLMVKDNGACMELLSPKVDLFSTSILWKLWRISHGAKKGLLLIFLQNGMIVIAFFLNYGNGNYSFMVMK